MHSESVFGEDRLAELREQAKLTPISDLLAKVAVDRDDDPWCGVAADEIERRDEEYQVLLDALKRIRAVPVADAHGMQMWDIANEALNG